MKFSLKDKCAVITGGASGIGRAITEVFLGQGAVVYVLDANADNLRILTDELSVDEAKLHSYACDITNHAGVKGLITEIETRHAINILVNNAGVAHVGNLEHTTEFDLDRLYSVNIKGTYNCCHAVIPHMKKKGGVILNVASVAATVGINDRFAYSMTKGAVVSMTLSIAKDYLSEQIRCNCISPARVHTPFVDGFLSKNYPGEEKEMFDKLSKTQPIGRMGKPEEVADLALYLCSDEAAFITGCDYPIDGGFLRLNN